MSQATTDALQIRDLDVPGYERVALCEHAGTGLRAIIAVHSTALGPALGGTRFKSYPDDGAALADVERLSEGMTYKAAAAGLDLGGGKAVIMGDPAVHKSPELLRAYGLFVESFGGTYITAADVGTNSDDLDIVGEATTFAVGRNESSGGLGDSGYSTAAGVLSSMRAAVRFLRQRPLEGLTVGVEGAGKVGWRLIELLLNDGARVRVSEALAAKRESLSTSYPEVELVDDLFDAEIDVYAPCAMGATLTPGSAARLRATVVCGAANNQLATADVADILHRHGIAWVPDYVANAGGLIQVDAERTGRSLNDVAGHVDGLGDSVTSILTRAVQDGVTAATAARRIVDDRLSRAAR